MITAATLIGCSDSSSTNGSSLSLLSTSQNDADLPKPLTIPVSLPVAAKIEKLTSDQEQSEIIYNLQNDMVFCKVQAITKPLGADDNFCQSNPDFCWITDIIKVDKYNDYACANQFRSLEILKILQSEGPDKKCQAQSFELSEVDLNHIQNPEIYKIKTLAKSETGGIETPNLTTILPELKTISLDSSCSCNYETAPSSTHYFKLPAMAEHCEKYFPNENLSLLSSFIIHN